MKTPDTNELIDKAMAGRLSPDEKRLWEALLLERPEFLAEEELGKAMRELPKPPAVSTNFTALVMQKIDSLEPARRPAPWLSWFRFPRLARLAGAAVVVAGVGSVVLFEQRSRQRELSDTVKSFASGLNIVAEQPQPDVIVSVMQDFDAIRQLPMKSGDVDRELLAALSER